MKKFSKIALIVSLTLAILSFICIGVSVSLGVSMGEFQRLIKRGEFNITLDPISDGKKTSSENKFSMGEVSSLKVSLKYGKLQLRSTEGDSIKVKVEAPGNYSYNCDNKDGVLTILDTTRKSIINWNSEVAVIISIPDSMKFDKVDLKTEAGQIELLSAITAENLEAEVNAGEFTAEKVTVSGETDLSVDAGHMNIDELETGTLSMDCGVGSIEIAGKVQGDASAECGMGSIQMKLDGALTDYNYKLESGVGKIQLNDESYSSLSEEKTIDNQSSRTIDLECGVGKIEVQVGSES